jgi:hypothetical protein
MDMGQEMKSDSVRMERRKSRRTRLDGEVECGVVTIESAELHDISHNGVRFTSLKRINPNSRQKIVIHFDSTVLNVRGTIVRSLISNSRMVEGRAMPVYEVALNFEHPLKDLAQVLEAH